MTKTPPIAKGDKKKIEKLLKKHFALPIQEAKNSKYKSSHFVKLLLVMSLLGGFAESVSNSLAGLPQADALLLKLKSLSISQIQNIFTKACEGIFRDAKHLFRREIYLAIDFHNKPYYGKHNAHWAVGTKKNKGTRYSCKFITIEIVTPSRRFTLLALPVSQIGNDKPALIEKLISYAKRFVKIKAVLLDKEFFTIDVINMLWALQVGFIIPAVRNNKVKEILEHFDKEVSVSFTLGKKYRTAHFQLILCKNEEGKLLPYATNIDLRNKPLQSIRVAYAARWGIETGYRVKEQEFCAKTCARSWQVRVFYFLFSVFVYNLWTLINSQGVTLFAMQRITAQAFVLMLCMPILLTYCAASLFII